MSLADELRDIAKHGWRFNAATILENAAKKLDAHAEADGLRMERVKFLGVTFKADITQPPATWRINVGRIGPRAWRTEFKVGAQSFTIAQDDSDEAEAHCVHMGECLASALKAIGASNGEICSDRGSRPLILSDDNARARGVGPWGVWCSRAWTRGELGSNEAARGYNPGDVIGWCYDGVRSGGGDRVWWASRDEAQSIADAMKSGHGDHYAVHPYTDGSPPKTEVR